MPLRISHQTFLLLTPVLVIAVVLGRNTMGLSGIAQLAHCRCKTCFHSSYADDRPTHSAFERCIESELSAKRK